MIRLTAVLALVCGPAWAQSNCAPRDVVVERLGAKYGEQFAGGGLQSTRQIFEVWFSPRTRTWTILMTRADGVSCIMASGTNWRSAAGLIDPEGIDG